MFSKIYEAPKGWARMSREEKEAEAIKAMLERAGIITLTKNIEGTYVLAEKE